MKMYKVTNSLYISGFPAASSNYLLRNQGITHIINMTYEYPNSFPDDYAYFRIPAKDILSERLGPRLRDIAFFAASAQHHRPDDGSGGGRVLVHCQQGISRSATAVLACLMINEGMRLQAAFALLKRVKLDVEPNTAFMRELRVLERDLFREYCREGLTALDRGGVLKELDYAEGITCIMAAASLSNTPYEGLAKESEVVRNALQRAAEEGQDALKSLVTQIVFVGLESFGSENERDQRARVALKNLLVEGLPKYGVYSLKTLKEMLLAVYRSEDLSDFALDVPKALPWVNELIEDIDAR